MSVCDDWLRRVIVEVAKSLFNFVNLRCWFGFNEKRAVSVPEKKALAQISPGNAIKISMIVVSGTVGPI